MPVVTLCVADVDQLGGNGGVVRAGRRLITADVSCMCHAAAYQWTSSQCDSTRTNFILLVTRVHAELGGVRLVCSKLHAEMVFLGCCWDGVVWRSQVDAPSLAQTGG